MQAIYPLVEQFGLSILRSQVEAGRFVFVFSSENAHQMDALEKAIGEQAQLIRGYGSVSAIGSGINSVIRNLVQFEAVVRACCGGEKGVLDISSTSNRMTALVKSECVKSATKALHDALVDQAS